MKTDYTNNRQREALGLDSGFPRRSRLDLNTPAELSIFNAIQEVEKAGCDVRLTDAINLLSKAKDLVADYVDRIESTMSSEVVNKTNFFYLIEDTDKSQGNLWFGLDAYPITSWNNHFDVWTNDADKAYKFKRREDAEEFLKQLNRTDYACLYSVTEHEFVSSLHIDKSQNAQPTPSTPSPSTVDFEREAEELYPYHSDLDTKLIYNYVQESKRKAYIQGRQTTSQEGLRELVDWMENGTWVVDKDDLKDFILTKANEILNR